MALVCFKSMRSKAESFSEMIHGIWKLLEIQQDSSFQQQSFNISWVNQTGFVGEIYSFLRFLSQVAEISHGHPGLGLLLRDPHQPRSEVLQLPQLAAVSVEAGQAVHSPQAERAQGHGPGQS